jgi:hypothetical protein
MIGLVLHHRCLVDRSTDTTLPNGRVSKVWSNLTPDSTLPCLYSRDKDSLYDPTWTEAQKSEAATIGTLFTRAKGLQLQPGDRITIIRPAGLGTYVVLPEASLVQSLTGASHREYRVRQL